MGYVVLFATGLLVTFTLVGVSIGRATKEDKDEK